MIVKIRPVSGHNSPGKLADAELYFTDGVLDGLKLVGFAVWQRRSGGGRNVTFPARQYSVNGERRSLRSCVPSKTRRRRNAFESSCCRRTRSTSKQRRTSLRESTAGRGAL